jgi:hypothetical protein
MTDEGKIEMMDMCAKRVLAEMKRITMTSTKKNMYEYIQVWENELQNLTYIVDYKL